MKKIIYLILTSLIFIITISLGEAKASGEVIIDSDTGSIIDSVEKKNGDKIKKSTSDQSLVTFINDNLIPDASSYYQNKDSALKASSIGGPASATDDDYSSTNYLEELYIRQLQIGVHYELTEKDMIVQNVVAIDENSQYAEYTSLPKGTIVTLQGFTVPGTKRYAVLKTDDNTTYYENVSSFYSNSVKSSDGRLKKMNKKLVSNAIGAGSLKGFFASIAIATILSFSIMFFINFLDLSVFKSSDAQNAISPYLNTCFRIMPGAMVGSFITLVNFFDKNAAAYYLLNFSIIGKDYRLSHWVIHAIMIIAIVLIIRIVLEGFRCFTFSCMMIRTFLLIIANIAIGYLCCILSFVGVAVYALFVVYQCVYYDSIFIASGTTTNEASPQPS